MRKSEMWLSLSIIVLVFVAWSITPSILNSLFETPESMGLFGDSFGALNSLFSGLAFAGVIIAILLQKNELKLQREDLKLTRLELSASTEAQKQAGNYLGEQSQIMKVTAELNGLSALIQAQTEQITFLNKERERGVSGLSAKIDKLNQDRAKNIEQLELLMHAVFCASEVEYR